MMLQTRPLHSLELYDVQYAYRPLTQPLHSSSLQTQPLTQPLHSLEQVPLNDVQHALVLAEDECSVLGDSCGHGHFVTLTLHPYPTVT